MAYMRMAYTTHFTKDKLIISLARIAKEFMLIDNRSIFTSMCGDEGEGGGAGAEHGY